MITFAIVACSVLAKAYEVGDIVPQNGFDAVVVYVDESGEHGLMISPHGMYQSQIKKAAKKAGISEEDYIAQMTVPFLNDGEKVEAIRKVHKQMLQENLNGTNGEQNAIDIANYCEQNGLPMETYFPEMYWAANLGEGWFIPGTDELELYANSIAYGVGKANYKKDQRFNISGKLPKTEAIQDKLKEAGSTFILPSFICSSTFANNVAFSKDKANKKKIAKINGAGILTNINYIYYGLCVYFSHMQWYYMFGKKGIDFSLHVYAFKRF